MNIYKVNNALLNNLIVKKTSLQVHNFNFAEIYYYYKISNYKKFSSTYNAY